MFTTNPTNLDIELLPPKGVNNFRKGDSVELDLELITLPRVADDYYGPNEAFRKHLTENPRSWKATYRETKGNDFWQTDYDPVRRTWSITYNITLDSAVKPDESKDTVVIFVAKN